MAGEWTHTPRRPLLMLRTQLNSARAGGQSCVKVHTVTDFITATGRLRLAVRTLVAVVGQTERYTQWWMA